jgi:hypothetical protein
VTIEGKEAELVPSMRILGVWLDPGLTWKDHITRAAAKGEAAFKSLARITASTWGPSVRKSRLIYSAVVRPAITYGAHIWAVNSKGESISDSKVKLLVTTQNKCIRRVLGAYKRTPTAAIERESGTPPIDIYL